MRSVADKMPSRKKTVCVEAATVLLAALGLVGCGGGGGSSAPATTPTSTTPTTTTSTTTTSTSSLAAMVDGFGNKLAEADFGQGDAKAAGASGTAADGAPITNAIVEIDDNAGHKVTGRTDAFGIYRLRIDGFVPPMIASVVKPDGTIWHSPSFTQPVTRGFINISISGLTDYVASKVASAGGLSSSGQLTPGLLQSNAGALPVAKQALNDLLKQQIIDAGLDPLQFDPIINLLVANGKGYDALLDKILVTNTPNSATVILPLRAISGTVVWPSSSVCVTTVTTVGLTACSLTLGLRSEQLPVNYPSTIFSFRTHLPAQDTYSVTILGLSPTLKARGSCGLSNAQGQVGATDVNNVSVFCN